MEMDKILSIAKELGISAEDMLKLIEKKRKENDSSEHEIAEEIKQEHIKSKDNVNFVEKRVGTTVIRRRIKKPKTEPPEEVAEEKTKTIEPDKKEKEEIKPKEPEKTKKDKELDEITRREFEKAKEKLAEKIKEQAKKKPKPTHRKTTKPKEKEDALTHKPKMGPKIEETPTHSVEKIHEEKPKKPKEKIEKIEKELKPKRKKVKKVKTIFDKRKKLKDVDVVDELEDTLKDASALTAEEAQKAKQKEKQKQKPQPKEIKRKIKIESDEIKLRDLANLMNIKASELIKTLMQNGQMATINDSIDIDTATLLTSEFNYEIEKISTIEEKIMEKMEIEKEKEENLVPRPPVVTMMGHVDHGKTSLLDKIRKSNITASEAGGITQHIGAYVVEVNKNKITFIDTPGHEAFTAMRARGAKVTDIVVLVVAADDGVMPQTVEAINHAKAADVPIIVAINKIDKANANPDKIIHQLMEHSLIPEELGGDTLMVKVSAKTGKGIDELLETILLQAEILELKANPDKLAKGYVIESKLDKGRGPVATILVTEGTMKIGDFLVAGTNLCKVRAMIDYKGKKIKKAPPSTPVEVLGFNGVPDAGDVVMALENEKEAKELIEYRINKEKEKATTQQKKISLEEFQQKMLEGELKELNIIIKTDVKGTADAIKISLEKLKNEEASVKIVSTGVGGITEGDVLLAQASNAIIIGFNVRPDSKARKLAEQEHIEIKTYSIIYDLIEDIKKALQGMLTPQFEEVYHGRVEVRQTFNVPKVGTVAGCYVLDGKITRNSKIRLLRDNVIIHDGEISSLKRFKDDVREVQAGYECGVGIANFNDIKVGDIIEAYSIEEKVKDFS
jgi:translation initiation factor IF-2